MLARLLDVVVQKFDCQLIFNSLPTQKKELQQLLGFCKPETKKAIMDKVYMEDLRLFLSVLSISNGYFGNEGGASNMARALGVPNYSIFSPWISKEAWLTDKNNTKNEAVHLADYKPEILEISKKERKQYYSRLLPATKT